MGMGRNSSRIASRRIANNSKDLTTFSGVISDDDDDVDWSVNNDKRKRRKERNGIKKLKQPKQASSGLLSGALLGPNTVSNNNSSSGSSSSSSLGGPKNSAGSDAGDLVYTSNENSPSNYESMSVDEKRILLQQVCGVMSEHTKKICTRSTRCPQHTDEQRKEVRANLEELSQSIPAGTGSSSLHADLETNAYDEATGELSRWDRDSSTTAGSNNTDLVTNNVASTTSSSRKREAKTKGKAKAAGKRERNSPVSSSHYIFLNT